jgi:ribosomal-protein-alanine N-acetyltransferase
MIALLEITDRNARRYLDQIMEIENLSFPTPWSLRSFQAEIASAHSRLWILKSRKDMIGYICFWMFANEIQLINVAVHPFMRNKGFGGHLLAGLIKTGESKGIHALWLEVRPTNVSALRLYRKYGFEEVYRRPRYYRDTGEDAIVMSLILSEPKGFAVSN